MESLLYEKKVKDMQKYIPFLENLITKLEKSQDGQSKSRESQLAKMRMLYELLTKRDKKLKLDTLVKCESVLAKLYKKVEQNINENESKIDKSTHKSEKTEKFKDRLETAELSAPASPQNSDNTVEFHAPIVIPTERTNSPNYGTSHRYRDKDTFESNRNKDKYDRHGNKISDSKTELYRRRSPSRYDNPPGRYDNNNKSNNRYSDKSSSSYDKFDNRKDRHYDESRHNTARSHERNNKYYERRPYSNSPNNEMWKSHENRTAQSTSNNSSNANNNNSNSSSTRSNTNISTSKTTATASLPSPTSDTQSKNRDTVFLRLGEKLDVANPNNYENFQIKIKNDKLKKKRAPTPLSEVLNSPPLSANDIDDLLNESGEKVEGRRKEEKHEKHENQELSELEAVRKKLNNEIGICKKKAKEFFLMKEPPSDATGGSSSPSTSSSLCTKTKLQSLSSKTQPEEKDQQKDNRLTVKVSRFSPLIVTDIHAEKGSSDAERSVTEPTEIIKKIMSPTRDKSLSQTEKAPQELPEIQSPTPSNEDADHSNIRLAYKYNPHPRRSIDSLPKSEESSIHSVGKSVQNLAKPVDPRVNRPTINTIPMSVNFADPRLRNRPLLPVPPPNLMDVNISKPVFSTLEVRRPSVGPMFSIFGGNYQQSAPQPVAPPVQIPNQLIHSGNPPQNIGANSISSQISPVASMSRSIKPQQPVQPPSLLSINIPKPLEPVPSNLNYNKFQPMLNDQVERMKYLESKKYRFEPKTYGEYRQAKMAEKKHKEPYSSPKPRRESIDITPPSCLDKLYRKSDFKSDVPSVSNFKIPKVSKPKPEESGKDKSSDIYLVSSDEETSNVKETTKKSTKQLEEKKEKSKGHSGSTSDREKSITGKTEEKKDKSKNDKQKTEQKTNKDSASQKPKSKTIGKDKDSAEEKSIKAEEQKKKSDSLDEKQENKKRNESVKQKKSSSDTIIIDKIMSEETKQAEIVETSKNDIKKQQTRDDDANDQSKKLTKEEETQDIKILTEDEEKIPIKPQPRRRKSVVDTTIPIITDGSEISTQNIITGKRRSRCVIPPPTPTETKQSSTSERKAAPPHKRKPKSSEIVIISESEGESHNDEQETKTNLSDLKNEKSAAKKEEDEEKETETKLKKLLKIESKQDLENICAVSSTTSGCSEEPHSSVADAIDVKKEEVKSDVTKEWLEGFLLNIFNPSLMNKDSVLNMLEKVLDDKKFKQIKAIMDENQEDKTEIIIPDNVAVPEEEQEGGEEKEEHQQKQQPVPIEILSEDKIEMDSKELQPTIEQKKKPKHKTELDRLNEDIRDMFISQGVLTATGRRMCTVINEEKKVDDKPKPPSKQIQKNVVSLEKKIKVKQPKIGGSGKASVKRLGGKKDVRSKRKGSLKKKRVLPKRGAKLKTQFLQNENSNETMNETESEQNENDLSMTYESESFNSEIDDAMPILEAQTIIKTPDKDRRGDLATLEEISSTPNDMKIKKKYKPCPKSKRKIQIDSDESSNSYDEDIYLAAAAEDPPQITIIEKSEDQAEIIIDEDESPNFLSAILEESNSIQCPNEQLSSSKTGQKGRRGRKKACWGDIMDTKINISFKNTNPDMHVKSEYVDKCILCGFVGKRMCNHYVHAHPDAEVPISRLPQNVLDVLKMSENKALFTYKKVDCNTVYYHKCPFCDIRSSYTRRGWMDHFGTHTGEYAFKCSECSRYMNLKQMIQKHIKHSCPNGRIINLRGIDKEKKRVVAHVCNLCNYLQMNRYTVMKHLIDQHDEDNELITTITLISCENVLRADETKRAAIIEEYEKSMKTGSNFGDDLFMTDSSKRSLSFISDELSERLRDTDDDVNLDMFEHSIFNDMSLVDRLSERLNADLDKQINSSNQVEQTFDANNKSITTPPPPLNMATNAEINQASDNSMSETTIYQNPNTSENDGLLNEQNNSSMANRLSERFNSQNNSPSKQQENDSSGSLSMAERLCQRFSTNSEEERQTDLSDNTPQAIVYVVDKIDEHNIANAGHVKANEIKLPRNEKENTLSFSDILNQRLKDNETSLPSSPVSARDNMPPVFENNTNNHPSTSENVFQEFRGESTTSLVERIKMRLNNGKNDSSTTTTNQTSICPGSAELSIVDRLSERLQNTTSGLISPQKNSSQQNHSTPKSRMSIVERLSQRLKSTTQDVSPDLTMTLSEEDLKLPETSKSSSEFNKSRISKSSNEVDSSYEGELIIDEERVVQVSKEVGMKEISNDTTKHTKDSDLTETITISSSQDEEDGSEITEICDNDDDWVDIETSPTEKPVVRDPPKRQDKAKKNKLTFETFSRLYAFNSKGRTGISKKEKTNKKVVKSNESCTLNNNTEVMAKNSEDKLMEINREKGDVRISSSSSPSSLSTRISTTEKDVPTSMEIDPLELPTEALSQLNVNHSIPWSSAEITKNIAATGRATRHNEVGDPLELPLGTEGQFICLTSSITTLPSTTNCLSTVMSGINPTISTISTSSPLCRDLGDISGLLGLNTNQLEINPVPNQTTTDPLEVNDLNSTLFVLSEQTSMQSNLVPILDVGNNKKTNKPGSSEISNSIDPVATIDIGNIQGTSKPGTSEISNPVDAVATEEKTRGFGIIESNSADCHNITGTNGVNSIENNGDSCSNGVTLDDPTILNSPVIHRIDKLGYSKSTENLIKYHCLVDSCSFLYSELPIGLQNHFITEHPDILWEGYCYSCEANVCNDEAMSLSREFKHMLEVHVKSLNDKVKISENNVKPPLIKFRRLSGDMLSVNQVPQEQSFLSSHEPVLLENDLTQQSSDEIRKDDQFSNGNQYQPKIHNKTTEPEKIFPLLKVTTKTSIINVPTKTTSNPVDQKSMLDAYLVRNNVPKMSDLVIAKVEEAVKDATIIVNNPSSSSMSSASDLKISSVAQNVNQDLIQQQNSASEPFFKIKEVISLSTSKPTLTSSTPTTTMSCGKSLIVSSTSKSPTTFTQTIATKPNVLQIQSATASSSPSSSSPSPTTIPSRHSLLLKPVKKSTNPIPTMSNLKIQSVTSMAPSINNDQLATPSSSEVCQIKDKTSGDGVLSVQQGNISTNILKPWIYSKSFKSKPIVEKLLQEISLYCLFKCMGYDCAFTTNSSLIMLQHLDNHEELAKKDNDPAAANAQNLGECPYCTDSHVKNKALLTHIVQTHGKDIYQCPYCFYRSSVDHNVMIHMNALHKGREKSILLCFGEQRRLATEIRNLANFRSINVRPIKCLDCSKGFYIVRNYVKHIKEHSPQYNSYKCSLCYAFVSKNLSEKHLLSRHNIAVYECIYCIFATEQMDTMRTHVANRHSSCLSYMCVRLSPNKNFDSTDETLELSTVLANLAESVDDKYLRRCPYTPIQLNSVNATPAIESNIKEKAISSHSPQSSLIMNQKYKNLEIASVQSISNEVFDNLDDRPKLPPPEATNDKEVRQLSQLSSSISSPSYSTMHLPSTSSSIIMPPPTSTIMPPPSSTIKPPSSSTIMPPPSSTIMAPPSSTTMPIPPSSSLPSSNFQSTNELQLSFDSDIVNRERAYIRILEAAREMVESTGLQGPELYKCAQCEQPSQIDTAMNFHLHLQGHISLGTTEIKCFHCAYSTKNLIALKNHLRIHSGHRYFCYFCNYTGSTAKMLIKHISDSHSKTGMILYPLIYGQTNKNKDFFVICPKNITPNELIQFGERMVRAWERKKALTKKYFTPDEIELLPRQAIFFNEVHCKVCDYRTKVRTNMFRHLQFHKQEVKVATVDPVNPVPCLNSNEKHFDKMLNLACSSNVNRSGSAATKEEPKVPEFIPHMKRYVCGVPGCTYLTISENMMKWHLSALHSNEKMFICSHCSLEVCKKNICGEKILDHLKYHDSKLFLCGECNYMHYQKPVVEQHINEKHPTGPCSIISYERDGTDTIKSTDPVLGRKTLPVNTTTTSPTTGKDEEMKWECGLCKARGPTYNQMVSHMNRTHDVKNRYQCVYCNFGGAQVSNIVVHVAEKHPTKVKEARCMFYKLNENPSEQKMLSDTTPIWTRDPARVKNIRGILMEDEEESQRNLLLDENYQDENEEEEEEQQQIISNNSEISSNRSGSGDGGSSISSSSSKDSTVYVPHPGINTTMSKENATNLNTTTKIPKTYGSAPKKRDEIKSCTQCLYTAKTTAEFQSHIKTFDHKALSTEMEQYVFFCFHCTGAYKTNTIHNLKRHWTMKHEIVKNNSNNDLVLNEMPFWYQLFPKVACGRCSYKNEIQSAVKHHQSFHFGTPLALVNLNNSKLCSQCPYEYRNLEDLGEHFSKHHPKITTPALALTNDLLDKFLKVGHRQRLIKCLKCNYVGGTVGNESFMVHHNKSHPNTSPLYDYIQDEILYLCTQCMFVSNDEEKTLRHMYEHPFNCTYKCTCNSKHKLFSEFAEHLDKVHKSKPNEFTVGKCIESKVRQLKDIRIILPNGLIFDKNQLNRTKYGDSSKIENIAKEEFSKYLSVTTTSSNVEKQNTPANVSDSENESLSSGASDAKRSSRARKRRRHNVSMGRNVDCIDKYGDEDNWTPHSKNKRSRSNASSKRSQSTSSKRSQNLPKNDRVAITTDTTTTNRKLEKVDLSKIFTTMTIAGSDVSISCDRFAKLVKIHTFVKVERIDISKYLTKANAICIKRKPKKLKNESNKKLKTS